MRKILLALPILLLLAAGSLRAQCTYTQVSGTVTDPNGLPYSYGTVVAQLQPTASTPTCGGSTNYISGTAQTSLDINGTFSMQLPSNTAITPSGTHWVFTVQGTAGLPPPVGKGTQSFSTSPITITGSTQSLTTTLDGLATALTVNLNGGSGVPCTTTASSYQWDNAGAFGCDPDFTFNGTHTRTLAAAGIFTLNGSLGLAGAAGFTTPASGGFVSSSTLNLGIDTTNDNAHFFNHVVDLIQLGIPSVPTTNHVAGYVVSVNQVTMQDLGATGGGGTTFPLCTFNGLLAGDYLGINSSGVCAELIPGLTPVNITASGSTPLLSTYRGQLVKGSSTTSAQTFALPDGTTTGFQNNFYFLLENHGTVGALSLTNNGGSYTFNGAASPFSLPEGTWCNVSSNSASTGWTLDCAPGLLTAGTGISLTQTQFGTTVNANAVPLTALATEAADTFVGNASGSGASPAAVAWPTTGTNGCAGTSNALTYNTTTHTPGCNTISSGGSSGTNIYTASHTATTSDNNAVIVMNCAGACALTLPNPQPSTTFATTFVSIGATNATIALGSSMTWNESATAPSTPLRWQVVPIIANGSTATDYIGSAPIEGGPGMSLVGNSYSLGINSTLGNASATVAARNTSLTTTHMATFLGVSGNNNVQVMISSYPSTLGVGCSTPTTIQYTIGYVDQNGNSVTQAGTNLLQTIATNGGPTDTTLTDQLNVTLTVPANINNSTGISYATTYTAGTCTTTNPSYTAQLRVIY